MDQQIVTNNEGSVTSHVSANTDAGFSIVKWTGNSNSSTTIGHGLNQKPEFQFLKTLVHWNGEFIILLWMDHMISCIEYKWCCK